MKNYFDATGEVLVVTGGSNGIGAAVANAFTAAGGTSVVIDVSPPGEEHRAVDFHSVDVSDRAAVYTAFDAIAARYGRIDGLVCAAAVQPRADVLATDPDMWRRTLAVNVDGVVWCCQAALPHMISGHKGAIVLFASGLANIGRGQAAAYAASKAALVAFAKSLAAEVAQFRVRVNTIFPGVIDTAQFRSANPDGPERAHWAATTGIGQTADVVGPLLFLLSDAATMTGSILTRERSYPSESRP